jgi:hypothetical protein
MRRATAAGFCLLIAGGFFVSGCGGDDRTLDPRGAQLLQAEVGIARDALARGDIFRAAAMLQAVEDTVSGLRTEGQISDRRAAEVLAALGEVQDSVRSWLATSTTVAPPTTATTPQAGEGDNDADGDDNGEGKQKNGKNRGRGKDD